MGHILLRFVGMSMKWNVALLKLLKSWKEIGYAQHSLIKQICPQNSHRSYSFIYYSNKMRNICDKYFMINNNDNISIKSTVNNQQSIFNIFFLFHYVRDQPFASEPAFTIPQLLQLTQELTVAGSSLHDSMSSSGTWAGFETTGVMASRTSSMLCCSATGANQHESRASIPSVTPISVYKHFYRIV